MSSNDYYGGHGQNQGHGYGQQQQQGYGGYDNNNYPSQGQGYGQQQPQHEQYGQGTSPYPQGQVSAFTLFGACSPGYGRVSNN
jgi:hypothetical protein